jgi:hypothetical protein
MRKVSLAIIILLPFAWFGALALAVQTDERAPVKSPHKRVVRPCEACHVSESFNVISFDHDDTEFSLEGQHTAVECLQCHNIEDFSQVAGSCESCHQDVHLNRLGTDCERCHSPQGWMVVKGDDIHSRTDFPLMGRHVLLDCEACHGGQAPTEFAETPSNCIDCHRSDYTNVESPDHDGALFSTLCTDCHQLTGWEPAIFPDHDPLFPIFSGTHRGQWDDCAICHNDPVQSVFTCLQCHEHAQPLMDAAHNGIGGYAYNSQDCYSCHPTGVRGAFVNHDAQFFPIYSGTHNRQWSNCVECHPNAADRSQFTCLSCHAHARETMDPFHMGMSGYSYSSNACLNCHPSGNRGRFVEHDSQFFPIFSGTHNQEWNDCAQCHPNPSSRAQIDCLQCHEHRRTEMDDKHQGMSGYSYTTRACLDCHPNGTK